MSESDIVRAVELDNQARLDEIVAVETFFRRAGFDVDVNAGYERRSSAVAWMVTVVLGVPIDAFLAALGVQAGSDPASALTSWVHELWQARTRPDGSVVLEDPDDTHVILATRVPDAAIASLAGLDWTERRGHYLVWDEARAEWRDPTR